MPDISLAKKFIDWEPKITLDEGLTKRLGILGFIKLKLVVSKGFDLEKQEKIKLSVIIPCIMK